MDHQPPIRHFVGMHVTDEQRAATNKVLDDWFDKRLARLMEVIAVLEKCNIPAGIEEWGEQAIAYLRKTPSARARMKFDRDDLRTAFLCVVLWYARAAVKWLDARENSGGLRGGISYRDMTANAASHGALRESVSKTYSDILPEEDFVQEALEDGDPRIEAYFKWSYIDADSFIN
ncbi:MAG: hypothetical protein PHI64_23170 [Zoogloea sp.]|uniref:hypothetical protein n=1 Tax=Zoogloea sp. TaxID=49181 RepID=UPI002614BC83|nr:hypothetical protein [Zoogloea sp.]MDD2991842.1 hypothetical protein [Zoogloea sp.]